MENNLEIVARLPWHKPEVQHLQISRTTADFLKDGSTEDLRSKANDWPSGAIP